MAWILFDEFDETNFHGDETGSHGLPWADLWHLTPTDEVEIPCILTGEEEQFLLRFMPDAKSRSRVARVSLSKKNKFPTILFRNGHLMQFGYAKNGKFSGIRASGNITREELRDVMRGFLANNESIDPAQVKIGSTAAGTAKYRPMWEEEWQSVLQEWDGTPPGPRRDPPVFENKLSDQPRPPATVAQSLPTVELV